MRFADRSICGWKTSRTGRRSKTACVGVDYVFHEAAIPSVPVSVADPVGTNGPNLDGTLAVLEAARQPG